ncbi:GumC family protein [Flavimaricola marinus]|uniref:Chain length determinant protein n=1 Tax=Flavimaricola marinus TaxID=1819565 RepID=A0A238LBE5_9RHOB|nr:Wzz/FepE/Etk N-terminal domain-containing protein [Flavimaricola marinus]SMY06883.1 Chain length determinant protein [Flavimaricola marinus]
MSQLTSPRFLLRMLWRRLPIILLVLMVGLPASVWFALQQPRLFEATAVIQIEAPQVSEQLTGSAAMTTSADSQLDLIQQKLMSRDNMAKMVAQFGLFPGQSPSLQVGFLREAVAIVKLVDPSQTWRPDVQPSGLAITVRLDDAELAAAVANEFVREILEEAQVRSEGRAARTLDFFVSEEARVSAEIVEIEARLAEFKRTNAAALPEGLDAQRDRLTRLAESQIAIDRQLIELQTSSDRLRDDELARQTDLLQQQRSLITENIRQIERALTEAPEVERQLNALNRELEQLNAEFVVITSRRTEAAMTQLLESQDQAERFTILETAVPPEFAVSASRKKIAMAGGVASLILALGAALSFETMNSAIRTADQLEAQLGIRPVIVVPNLTTRRTRMQRGGGWLIGLAALLAAAYGAVQGWFAGLLDLLPFSRTAASGQ